jgi:flagellar hook-associated protein 3 FlgL
MRVTSLMMVDNAIQHMTENMEALSNLQERASTGKLIRTPADDPSVAVTGLSLRSTLATHAAYQDSAQTTLDWLDANDLALGNMVELGTRALNLAKQGISDTMSVSERQAIATDIDGVLQNAVSVANSAHQGKYIFAGYSVNGDATGQPPFAYPTGPSGAAAVDVTVGITAATPLGDTSGAISHTIERGQTIRVNIDGMAAFQPFFSALVNVRNALQNPPYATATLSAAITQLDNAVDSHDPTLPPSLSTIRTTNGDRVKQVNMALDRMTKTGNALKNLLSHKEDANLAETISMLNHQTTVYQAVLNVAKNAIPSSLFDFLK